MVIVSFILGIYQPVKFGIVLTKQVAQYFDLSKPDRFVLFRAGNTTLVSTIIYTQKVFKLRLWYLAGLLEWGVKHMGPLVQS